jgi:hypothetical protein
MLSGPQEEFQLARYTVYEESPSQLYSSLNDYGLREIIVDHLNSGAALLMFMKGYKTPTYYFDFAGLRFLFIIHVLRNEGRVKEQIQVIDVTSFASTPDDGEHIRFDLRSALAIADAYNSLDRSLLKFFLSTSQLPEATIVELSRPRDNRDLTTEQGGIAAAIMCLIDDFLRETLEIFSLKVPHYTISELKKVLRGKSRVTDSQVTLDSSYSEQLPVLSKEEIPIGYLSFHQSAEKTQRCSFTFESHSQLGCLFTIFSMKLSPNFNLQALSKFGVQQKFDIMELPSAQAKFASQREALNHIENFTPDPKPFYCNEH